MTSFRTPTRFSFWTVFFYFCPHIDECANIAECAQDRRIKKNFRRYWASSVINYNYQLIIINYLKWLKISNILLATSTHSYTAAFKTSGMKKMCT
jgi:hypothetical protein